MNACNPFAGLDKAKVLGIAFIFSTLYNVGATYCYKGDFYLMEHDKNGKLTNEKRTQLKRYALESKHPQTYNNLSRQAYKAYDDFNFELGDQIQRTLFEDAYEVHPQYLNVVNSLIRSRQAKAKNVKDKIAFQLSLGQSYFLTLTFTDEVLATTSEATRRKYVQRFLKANSFHYLANIDFGGQTAREHYHAVLSSNVTANMWPYGFIKCIPIGNDETAPVKIGKYITKLKHHALKDSTNGKSRFRALIYSRNK